MVDQFQKDISSPRGGVTVSTDFVKLRFDELKTLLRKFMSGIAGEPCRSRCRSFGIR